MRNEQTKSLTDNAKNILAEILHEVFLEFKRDSVDDIVSWIDSKLLTSDDLYTNETTLEGAIVFMVHKPGTGNSIVKFNLDNMKEEATSVSQSKKSDPIRDGIFQAASLLYNESLEGKGYETINKVYSIWICQNDLNIVRSGKMRGGREVDLTDEFVHRYKIGQSYDSYSCTMGNADSDLLEVVFIEINRMENYEGNEHKRLKEILYKQIKRVDN